MKIIRPLLQLLVIVSPFLLAVSECIAATPVEFAFRLPVSRENPFARDVWADVIAPSGKTLRLPAFYVGGTDFAVRARATEAGEYRLGPVTEKIGTAETVFAVELVSADTLRVAAPQTMPQVGLDAGDRSRLVLAGSGVTYAPIGANLAWPSEGRGEFYEQVLPQFAAEKLNWARVWMTHWAGLNLDWLPQNYGDSPPAGRLDLRVAQEWDRIVAAAERTGVYLQIVLQHHGQVSSRVNSNWALNPWNAANPHGFLREPKDFFTSPAAQAFTKQKYRYIVARWGYSPAVLAWELFNEVHWVDPINLGHDESTVAQWHARMADYLRSVDVYGHLVTTSTENLRSPVYERMDYFQPHLYPYALLAGPLAYNLPCEKLPHPVFYGEMGDDNAALDEAQKDSGIAIVPPVWVSLMGPGRYAAQPWVGEKLLQSHRLGELGAVARFVLASDLSSRPGLQTFSPRVECPEQVPLVVEASQVWQRRAAPDFVLPVDGRVPVELGEIPRAYVGSPKSLAEGLPGRATYHVDFPRATALRARVTGAGAKGTAIRISLEGKPVVEQAWAAGATARPRGDHPVNLTFSVPAGPHTLVVENPGAEDWFQLDAIEMDLAVPAIAAIGKRSENFVALWLWHRAGVFALNPLAPVAGTLLLEEVPAGKWTVTWWDTIQGVPAPAIEIEHRGGLLRLPVPAFNRHVAVMLTR